MLTKRFSDDLARLAGIAGDARFGLAVSGGPDSLALLLLAQRAAPGRIAAATVDHGLRAEAAAEAAMVAEIAGQLGVPHTTLRPATPITGSVQAAARAVRYRLLEAWRETEALDWVLTAHHADDQAETLLMRLNRGAGVGGLAGIRAVNGRILRPLLGWRRAELAAVVAAAGVEPVEDPSNGDPRFDRVRLRTALGRVDWIDVPNFAASAAHLADAEEAIGWTVARIADERLTAAGEGFALDPAGLPAELLRRLLLAAIARLDSAAAPSGPELDRLIAAAGAGSKASIGTLSVAGGAFWRIFRAPPRSRR